MSNVPDRSTEQPDVQPSIAELLRTCVHPPILTLRIDHLKREEATKNASDSEGEPRKGSATRLYLTDGQLLIQAFIHRRLSSLPEIVELEAGDVLEIHDFVVKKSRRKNGRGHVVFLGIEDCYVVKSEKVGSVGVVTQVAPATECEPRGEKRRLSVDIVEDDAMAGGFFKDDETKVMSVAGVGMGLFTSAQPGKASNVVKEPDSDVNIISPLERAQSATLMEEEYGSQKADHSVYNHPTERGPKPRSDAVSQTGSDDDDDDDDENSFEIAQVDLGTAKKRRMVLHELDQNLSFTSWGSFDREITSVHSNNTSKHDAESECQPHGVDVVEADHDTKEQVTPPHEQPPDISEDLNKQKLQQKLQQAQSTPVHFLTLPPASFVHPSLNQPTIPLDGPLQNLASLYSPSIPSKSYVLSALVIPTWVSTHLISRPNSPFPPKRHIKVIDISLAKKIGLNGTTNSTSLINKGITVSVYRDASSFKPTVGKVALIRGVVMQKLRDGEIILNVYPQKSKIQKQSQSQNQPFRDDGGKDDLSTKRQRARFVEDNSPDQRREERRETTTTTTDQQIRDLVDAKLLWFIDSHALLKERGFDVDPLQKWWDERYR